MNRFINFMGRVLDKVRSEWRKEGDVWKLFFAVLVWMVSLFLVTVFALLCYSLTKHPMPIAIAAGFVTYWILMGDEKGEE